jgi:DNA-binding NtrC family response regulator
MTKRFVVLAIVSPTLRESYSEAMATSPHEAVSDVETLVERVRARPHAVVVLDAGFETAALDRLAEDAPMVRTLVVAVSPTLEAATDAMRRGACDYVPMPRAPAVIRELVERVVRHETHPSPRFDYDALWRTAARLGRAGELDASSRTARAALERDPSRPEAYVVLAALEEIHNRPDAAQAYLRAALVFSPTHAPAEKSLTRLTRLGAARAPLWGDE